jgi:hypothetical protein
VPALTLPPELAEVGAVLGRVASGSDSARNTATLLGQGVAWTPDRLFHWAAGARERRIRLRDIDAEIAGLAEQAAAARADRLALLEIGWRPLGVNLSTSGVDMREDRYGAERPAHTSTRPAPAGHPSAGRDVPRSVMKVGSRGVQPAR